MPDEKIIEVGMVVALKSGGPQMTVERVDSNNITTCMWFDECSDIRSEQFDAKMLDAIPKS